MNITTITVRASRKFNHPSEAYANFGHEVVLTVALDPNDDVFPILHTLRRQAETIAEDHKRDILADVQAQQKRERLESLLSNAENWPVRVANYQKRIAGIQARVAKLNQWDTLRESEQTRLLDYPYNTPDEMREYLVKEIASFTNAIAQERQDAAGTIDRLRAEIAALPPLTLLPEARMAAKEIHPGHPDHPDTRDDDGPY